MGATLQGQETDQGLIAKDTFVRIEDKFLVPNQLQGLLTSEISKHCRPSYLDATTKFTLVESIYFDSHQLDLFQHHFSNLVKRSKLRIRRYAPNGSWDNGSAFLEAKTKVRVGQDSISSKKRFRIDQDSLDGLMGSQELVLSQSLRELNPKMGSAELLERIDFVNNILNEFKLSPQLRIQYERLAFENDDVRVTMDKNIELKQLNAVSHEISQGLSQLEFWKVARGMTQVFSNEDYFVCEVKHSSSIPMWLQDFFNKNRIEKVSFSKYCWGLTNLLDRSVHTLEANA